MTCTESKNIDRSKRKLVCDLMNDKTIKLHKSFSSIINDYNFLFYI